MATTNNGNSAENAYLDKVGLQRLWYNNVNKINQIVEEKAAIQNALLSTEFEDIHNRLTVLESSNVTLTLTQEEFNALTEQDIKNLYESGVRTILVESGNGESNKIIINADTLGGISASEYMLKAERTHWKEPGETIVVLDEDIDINSFDSEVEVMPFSLNNGVWFRGDWKEYDSWERGSFNPKPGQHVTVQIGDYTFSGILNKNLQIGDAALCESSDSPFDSNEPLTHDYYFGFTVLEDIDYNCIYIYLNPELGFGGTTAHITVTVEDVTYHTIDELYLPDVFASKTDIETLREQILDLTYPVGSIYMAANSISPASRFGGTWTRIQDRFLLAAGSSYSAGKSGGSATHTLTVDEMPSHWHTLYQQNSAGDNSLGLWDTYVKSSYQVLDQKYDSSQNIKAYAYGTGAKGGGAAHNNMPPYYTVYVWRRTA